LFEKLKVLRAREALRLHVPPYVVFGDKALIQMAKDMPETPEAFLEIYGVSRPQTRTIGKTISPSYP